MHSLQNLAGAFFLPFLIGLSSAVSGTAAPPPSQSFDPGTLRLAQGKPLEVGDSKLVMQGDGNLVLYGPGGIPLWYTGTSGQNCDGNQCFAVFQSDGNFVVYNGPTPLWNSGTAGNPNTRLVLSEQLPQLQIVASSNQSILWANVTTFSPRNLRLAQGASVKFGNVKLVMQGDGNLVLYAPGGVPLWDTGTFAQCASNQCFAVFQGDGNFVVYDGATPLWNSGTSGDPGARLVLSDQLPQLRIVGSSQSILWANVSTFSPGNLKLVQGASVKFGNLKLVMQRDGNLVLYAPGGVPLWSSGTSGQNCGSNQCFAVFQGDGNFVVYNGSTPLWNSGTSGDPDARLIVSEQSPYLQVVGMVDLVPQITHSGNFTVGSQVSLSLTASNTGSVDANAPVTLTDTLPDGLSLVQIAPSTWTCQAAMPKITCTRAVPLSGHAVSDPVMITLNVAGPAGSYTNGVAVAGVGETDTTNNQLNDPITIAPAAGVTAITSDDFHSSALNTALWSFVNPLNDGKVVLNGTHALLSVPAGTAHDVWTGANNAPRLLQAIPNSDFDIQVKFDSPVDLPCQMQGLIVQQDLANFLRFEVYSNGANAHVFAASFTNGSPAILFDKVIGNANGEIALPFYLGINRTGNAFSFRTSTDGANFTEAGHLTRTLAVNQVGPHAGNNTCGYTAPAFTASIDYFFNSAAPIVPQDGVPGNNPVINVWYGDTQTFGQNGIPQTWVNILGTALSPTGPIQKLQYSLNGAAAQPLSIGSGIFRLSQPGDFNVEIPYSSLNAGANTVAITALDSANNSTTHNVTVNYVAGQTWPIPYSITWTPTTNLQSVVQVVDGKWQVQPDGTVRTEQIGYDRLLNLGDMSAWKNYVVTAEATIHYINDSDIAAPPDRSENVFGVGIMVGWKGHTQDIFGQPNSQQPRIGHPFTALGWYSNSGGIGPVLGLYQNTPSHPESVMTYAPSSGLALQFETKYVFKVQVTTNADGITGHYRLKVWPAATEEPTQWTVEADGDLNQGSVILAAHRTDVSFGNVTVTGVP